MGNIKIAVPQGKMKIAEGVGSRQRKEYLRMREIEAKQKLQ